MFRDCNGESNGLEVICQNMKLENIFSKSNLVDGSFHFSFLMKQRLQSLKLPAMATKELNQNNSVDTFLLKEGPPQNRNNWSPP